MAEMLDFCETPIKGRALKRIVEHERDATLFLPQATSSPRIKHPRDDSQYHNNRDTAVCESMSHTTSQTPSWQKHSIKPSELKESLESFIDRPTQNLNETNLNEHKSSATNSKSDYSAARRPAGDLLDLHDDQDTTPSHQWEETPSPARMPQQFYTAKQFAPKFDETLMVELLRISSPITQHFPSTQRAPGVMSFDRENDLQSQHHENIGHIDAASPYGNGNSRLRDNGRRSRSISPVSSELSKVDPQAESLQKAVSYALNPKRAETQYGDESPSCYLPRDESIAMRYRLARSDRSHNNTKPAHQSRPVIDFDLPPKNVETRAIEPLKPKSPLITQEPKIDHAPAPPITATPTPIHGTQDNENRRQLTPQATSPTAREAELLAALTRVNDECERRGQLLETMISKVAQDDADQSYKHKRLETEQRLQQIEQILLQQKRKTDQPAAQIADRLASHQPSQQVKIQEQPVDIERTSSRNARYSPRPTTNCAEPCSQDKSHFRPAVYQEPSIPSNSVQERIMLWGQEVPSNPEELSQRRGFNSTIGDLTNEQRRQSAQIRDRSGPRAKSALGTRSPLLGTEQAPYPLHTPLVTPIPIHQQGKVDDLRFEDEIRRASVQADQRHISERWDKSTFDRRQISDAVRPLTADMMPDAADGRVSREQKIYHRLQLSKVDHMERNELGNLVKNILLQLDVALPDLPDTITNLGHNLLSSKEDVHQALISETFKLREFAENVHATLYGGDHIEGIVTSRRCLTDMNNRIGKLQRAYYRR